MITLAQFSRQEMAGTQVIPEEVTGNSVSNPPAVTTPVMTTSFVATPVTGRTEKASGFEAVLSILTQSPKEENKPEIR